MNFWKTLMLVFLLLTGSSSNAQIPGTLLPSVGSNKASESDNSKERSGKERAIVGQDQITSEVNTLLRLLADERVVRRLREQLAEQTVDSDVGNNETFSGLAAARLQKLRVRASQVTEAIKVLPDLPGKLGNRWRSEMTSVDSFRSVIYLLIFLFIGFGLEWLYWSYASLRLHQLELSNVAGLRASARRAWSVGLLRLAGATTFSIGCIGTFLFFDWEELAGQVVFAVLSVAVSLRVLLVVLRVIFAPASEHLRMVPLSTQLAKRCVSWIFIVIAAGLASRLAADTFLQIGIDRSASISVYFLASSVLAGAFLVAVWAWFLKEKPLIQNTPSAGYALASTASSPYIMPFALTVLALVVLVLDTLAMHQIKWLLLMIALLLPAISISKCLVDYYFDRALSEVPLAEVPIPEVPVPDSNVVAEAVLDGKHLDIKEQSYAEVLPDNQFDDTAESHPKLMPFNIYRPVTQRLMRILVIIFAVLILFAIVDMPLGTVYQSDRLIGRVVSAFIDVAAILLIADLLWVWAKTLIDRRLSEFEAPAHGQLPGPGARMATLLPLFRKVIFTVIAIMVVLVVLSSLGVNIAPLLAGAGVIGIAVGFGAQALVKDVVSGVFFLLEDAFRVGEYIEMGDLRGTVESISLRSLRVRHHLGAVHTIPYGELTSLTNHSRDWAIIKMEFRVPFDTDIKLVKKIVKKIGAELQQNEVYGHHIIEPLKSQGVRRMEEFNMVVGVKFMSEPGQQWTIRRDAYQAIRDAFDKNGLSFAERSVKVEVVGDGAASSDAVTGAAQDAIEEQLGDVPKIVDDTP